jgi:NADH-quinone oxidoreductase subunit N
VIWTSYLPAAVAAAGAIVALALDAWDFRRAAVGVAAAGSLSAGVTALLARPLPALSSAPLAAADCGGGVGLVVGLLGAIALAGGWRRLTTARGGVQAAALGAFTVASSLLAIAARDLVTLTVAIEAMALAAYGLVALAGTDRSREAATKYFVQGAVATGLLVLGLGVMSVSGGGSLAYGDVFAVTGSFPRSSALLAWALLVSVLAFKAGAFPFHSWAPDAYETADPPVAALLSSVPKIAVVFAALVLLAEVIPDGGFVAPSSMLAVLAAAGIVFGNLAALRQGSLTRMLAYSGIAQVGYALVGIAAGRGPSTLVFMAAYGLAACGAFLAAEAVRDTDPGWTGSISGLAGLSHRRPALSAAIAVLMLSLTGIPLFAGFVGKLSVFAGAAGHWTWLVMLGVVGSVVSFGYYGSVIRAAYLLEDGEAPAEGQRPGAATAAVVACAVVTVVLGLVPLLLGTGWLAAVIAR